MDAFNYSKHGPLKKQKTKLFKHGTMASPALAMANVAEQTKERCLMPLFLSRNNNDGSLIQGRAAKFSARARGNQKSRT